MILLFIVVKEDINLLEKVENGVYYVIDLRYNENR